MNNRPICIDCELEMEAKKNGALVEEMADFGSYRLVMGDIFECPNCNISVMVGRAMKPIAEHYQKDYAERVKREKSSLLPWQTIRAFSTLREKQEYEEAQK